MMNVKNKNLYLIDFMIVFSGLAALSWTVLWQLCAGLALGVSAWGAALTLAITMGGMCFGSLGMGRVLKKLPHISAFRLYGILEIIIGISGLFLLQAFKIIEALDTQIYASNSDFKVFVHLFGIIIILGLPAMCMGATTPVFGKIAQYSNTSLSILYGLNTLGAAAGALLAAFTFIPMLGIHGTAFIIAAINLSVGAISIFGEKEFYSENKINQTFVSQIERSSKIKIIEQFAIVFISGFATLALEVVWFRSFTAAFYSTTAAFSVMLASILLSLGLSASCVPLMKLKKIKLSFVILLSGIFVLLATPLIERFDIISNFINPIPALQFMHWFILTTLVTGPAIFLLGLALPWTLEEPKNFKQTGMLYGFNTFAAVIGSLTAGWIFLPALGVARTSWLIGALLILTGIVLSKNCNKKQLVQWIILGCLSAIIAIGFESGVGRTRLQVHAVGKDKINILAFQEGPDVTISVLELADSKDRALIIDGFIATGQSSDKNAKYAAQYMQWMGHLPMILHPEPHNALVICFGTGQTANAVRKENPDSLTIVDINPNVFKMAPYFKTNEDVLNDKRVNHMVMDGRAFLRRTQQTFDVITLEPMPPTFAGVNALYSEEFYKHAYEKLTSDGMIAQWVPFHLLSVYHAASIAKTFQKVFPNNFLWIDPVTKTGILIGTKNENSSFGENFPGLIRNKISRILSDDEIKKAVYLNKNQLLEYGTFGDIITDDNQILAYGKANYYTHSMFGLSEEENFEVLDHIKNKYINTP